MKTRGRATLLSLMEMESARRGLSRAEMIDCLVKAIEQTYARRGFHVQVEIDQADDKGELKMTVRKMLVQGGDTVELTVRDILIPTQEDLALAVEELRETIRRRNPWQLCEATVLTINDDHYLVECKNGYGSGQIAVLPKANAGNKLEKSQLIVCVVQPFRAEKVSGVQHWMTVDAPLVASRTDRQLIIQMVELYFGMRVDAAVISSAAMIITPPGMSIAKLIDTKEQPLSLIKQATGLERVFVGPLGANMEPKARIQNAVRNVTGLKYPSEFRISEPKGQDAPLWRVFVATGKLGRFIGREGQNLFFIMILSGLQFDYLERPMWSGENRGKSSAPKGDKAHAD